MDPTRTTPSEDAPQCRVGRRRWWRIVLVGLAVWQLAVFAIAGGAHLAGVGRGHLEIPEADRELVRSLVTPSQEAVEVSLTRADELRQLHGEFAEEWHNASRRILAGESSRAVSKELKEIARAWPPPYRHLFGTIVQDEKWPARRALEAVQHGCYDATLIPLLRGLPYLPGHQSKTWKRVAVYSEALILIDQGRYEEAGYLLETEHTGLGMPAPEVLPSLLCVQADPCDFDARLELGDELCRLAYGSWFRSALADAYWRVFDLAEDYSECGRALLRLARQYPVGQSPTDPDVGRDLYVAAGRLLAAGQCGPDVQAKAIAAFGDRRRCQATAPLSIALYEAVFRSFPGTGDWARSTFNYGHLLHQAGHPADAVGALRSIMDSGANDLEPAPCIMEAYRNYRHHAAREMAQSYGDLGNFPMDYYWTYRGSTCFPYRTWCGTCQRSEEKQTRRELMVGSLRAGPVFLVWNTVRFPRQYWPVLVGGALVGAFWWRRSASARRSLRPRGYPADGAVSPQ